MTLAELPIGASAVVVSVRREAVQRRRLLDFGLVPGALVSAEQSSALGDPRAYRVRGGLIALRRHQAAEVLVSTDLQSALEDGHTGGVSR